MFTALIQNALFHATRSAAKELDVPFVPQRLTISKVTKTIVMADGTAKKAFNLDTAICVCNQKATASDKRHKPMECHPYMNKTLCM